jgi:hypothetical protein
MPLCRNMTVLRRLLEAKDPGAMCIHNLVSGAAGSKAEWVRVDDLRQPRAVLCGSRFLYLHALDSRSAAAVAKEVPGKYRAKSCNVSAKYTGVLGQPGATLHGKPVYLYTLDEERHAKVGIDVGVLRPKDADVVYKHHTDYELEKRYIRDRIRLAPSCAIRRNGNLVAWGLTHDCGAMGLLHVVDDARGQDLGTAILWLWRRACRPLALGHLPT